MQRTLDLGSGVGGTVSLREPVRCFGGDPSMIELIGGVPLGVAEAADGQPAAAPHGLLP